jgi:rRNA maturation protein Nop10
MKTNTHPGDYDRRPRNAAKEYSFPTCPKCGEPTLPSMTDKSRAHCPKCGDVALCMVPATHLEEMREEIRKAGLGPQEPPDDPCIFNRKQADGTYPPLSKFFDDAVAKADAGLLEDQPVSVQTAAVYGDLDLSNGSTPSWWNSITEEPF